MNAAYRDPILDGLDRLARLADHEVAGDRMPDIRRRARAARQRRVAATAVAAVAALALGVGLWKILPADDEPPQPVLPTPELMQTVAIQPVVVGTTELRISFTVSGRSSDYVTPDGSPVDAGPFGTRLSVDGEEVGGSDPGDVACEAGSEVSSYSLRFPGDRGRYTATVSGPGEHEIVVHAPYCADGELVDVPTSMVVTTTVEGKVVDRARADLDGDGKNELVELLAPRRGDAADALRVTWPDGETSASALSPDWVRTIDTPYDLDADGSVEIVLSGGGGEFLQYDVFRVAGDRSLVPVQPVNQDGSAAELTAGVTEGQPLDVTWQVSWTPGIFVSWRAREATPQRPATVDVRRWTLEGDRLVQGDVVEPGCWQVDFSVTVGGC